MSTSSSTWETQCPVIQHTTHPHDFGQGQLQRAEKRAWSVAFLTLVVMVAEVVAGLLTGSMALLADGIHMGGHAIALGLAAGAYFLARRYAQDRRLSFGSGKIKDLAAYTSALLLGVSSIWLVVESVHRLLAPEPLYAFEAMVVAIIGLVVNVVSISCCRVRMSIITTTVMNTTITMKPTIISKRHYFMSWPMQSLRWRRSPVWRRRGCGGGSGWILPLPCWPRC